MSITTREPIKSYLKVGDLSESYNFNITNDFISYSITSNMISDNREDLDAINKSNTLSSESYNFLSEINKDFLPYKIIQVNEKGIESTIDFVRDAPGSTAHLLALSESTKNLSNAYVRVIQKYSELYNDKDGANKFYSNKISRAGYGNNIYSSLVRDGNRKIIPSSEKHPYFRVTGAQSAVNYKKDLELIVIIRGVPVKMRRFIIDAFPNSSKRSRYDVIFKFPEYIFDFAGAVESIDEMFFYDPNGEITETTSVETGSSNDFTLGISNTTNDDTKEQNLNLVK